MSLWGSPSPFIKLLKGALLFRLATTPPRDNYTMLSSGFKYSPICASANGGQSSHEVHTTLTEGKAEWEAAITRTVKSTFSCQVNDNTHSKPKTKPWTFKMMHWLFFKPIMPGCLRKQKHFVFLRFLFFSG